MAYSILIVDDSSLTRTAIKRIIDMVDIEIDQVFESGDGQQAFEILDNNTVDLVLADLNMPEMGGVEMIDKMKETDNYNKVN